MLKPTLSKSAKFVKLLVLILVALLSVVILSRIATSPSMYTFTIQSLDDRKTDVMLVTASAAATSTALALVPSDATTPIANQIMEISEYLFIVVCVIALEKFLLTTLGYISFVFLIPCACLLFGIFIFNNKHKLKELAVKIMILALVLVFIIPFCVKVSDLMYALSSETIEHVTDEKEIEKNLSSVEEEKSWFESTIDSIKDGFSSIGEYAKSLLNNFIDAIALFVISCCVLPILIVIVVLWLIKRFFGLSIPIPKRDKLPKFRWKNKTTEMIEQ